jgi:hypothetical protein
VSLDGKLARHRERSNAGALARCHEYCEAINNFSVVPLEMLKLIVYNRGAVYLTPEKPFGFAGR